MYVSVSCHLALSAVLTCQTLPIGYYPALSDDDLDTILGDEREYTVEWMITPAANVGGLDPATLLHNNPLVSLVACLFLNSPYMITRRCIMLKSAKQMCTRGRKNRL